MKTHVIYLLLLAVAVFIIFQKKTPENIIYHDVDTVYVNKVVTVKEYIEVPAILNDTIAVAEGVTNSDSLKVSWKIKYSFIDKKFALAFDNQVFVSDKIVTHTIYRTDKRLKPSLIFGVTGNPDGYTVSTGVGINYKRIGIYFLGNTQKEVGGIVTYEF